MRSDSPWRGIGLLLAGHVAMASALLGLAWLLGTSAQADAAKAVLVVAMLPGATQLLFVLPLLWRLRRAGRRQAMVAVAVGAAVVMALNAAIAHLVG